LISNLMDADGNRLKRGFGTVDSIILPTAGLDGASWDEDVAAATDGNAARILYVPEPGSPRPDSEMSSLQVSSLVRETTLAWRRSVLGRSEALPTLRGRSEPRGARTSP
jgi:hypothetical protein